MDHIPNANDCRLDIEIPHYARGLVYDGREWATYPQRAGYPWLSEQSTVQELNAHARQCSTKELQAFAQSWMFFAVLQNFLGVHYSEADFIRIDDDSGTWVISTSVAQEWEVRENDRTPILRRPGKADISINTPAVTQLLLKVHAKAVLFDRFASGKDESWARLALSFKILVELLSYLPKHIARMDDVPCSLELAAQPGPALDILRKHLAKSSKAWCPRQLEALCSTLSYSALLYLTDLNRMRRDDIDHAQCTEHRTCVAFNTEIDVKIETAHEEEGCGCEPVSAPREERARILERGDIPVLRCLRNKKGRFDLNFMAASPDLKYAAISHLWADGLGNPSKDSLPHCRLSRLVNAVQVANRSDLGSETPIKTMYEAVFIWLDVYCVPAQIPQVLADLEADARSEFEQRQDIALKKKAIARMEATYAWADYVLVLDRELMQMVAMDKYLDVEPALHQKGPQFSDTRTIAYMAISAWNTRCWTYQEHAFARSTVLQGIDCQSQFDNRLALNATHASLQHDFMRLVGRRSVMGGGVKELIAQRAGSRARTKPLTSSSPFGSAWNLFHGRSSTHSKDMVVILANMLDLSAAAILQLDFHMQMKAIIASHKTLPLSTLFVDIHRLGHGDQSQGASILEDRWVPSMPQSALLRLPVAGDSMLLVANGLLLHSKHLQSQGIWTLRLPIIGGHLDNSFQVLEQDVCDEYWIAVELEELLYCMERLPLKPTEAIVILDHSDAILSIDETAISRGACLLATGYEMVGKGSERAQSTIYVGPLTWGKVLSGIESEGPPPPLAGHVSTSDVPSILISGDLASWPKLPPSRARKLRSVKNMRWVVSIVHFLVLLIGLYIGYSGYSANKTFFKIERPDQEFVCDPKSIMYTADGGAYCVMHEMKTVGKFSGKVLPAGGILIAGVCSLSVFSWSTYIVEYAMLLQLMYGVHSEVDTGASWWRQLHTIFKLMVLRELRWSCWPEYLVLRMVVGSIAVPVLTWEKLKNWTSLGHGEGGVEGDER